MHWCESDEWNLVESHGLSTCGCQSLQLLVSLTYLILFVYFHFKIYSKLHSFDTVDNYTLTICRSILFGCVVEAALVIVEAVSEPFDIALISSTVVETAAWILCAYNVHLDVWYIAVWPRWPVKLFLCVETVVILLTATSLYDSSQTTYRMILGALAFVVVILLTVVSFLKDLFRDREEVSKYYDERRRYASNLVVSEPLFSSEESGNKSDLRDSFLVPRTSSANSSSNGWLGSAGISLQKLFFYDKPRNPYEAISIQDDEENNPRFSIWNILKKSGQRQQSPRSENFARRDDVLSSSPKNSTADPLVRSALERHLDGSTMKISQRSAFSREVSTSTRSDSPRVSFNDGRMSSGNQSVVASDRTISSTDAQNQSIGSKSSGALQRALDMQRSRLYGSKGNPKPTHAADHRPGRDSTTLSSQSLEGAVRKDTEYYITIQRWVLRRPQSSHILSVDDGNESAQHSSRTSSTDGKPLLQSDGISEIDVLYSGQDRSLSPIPPNINANSIVNASELEFEIAVHRGTESNLNQQSSEVEWLTSGAEISTSGRLRHEKRSTGQWTIWKTSHELYALHSALVNSYGDAAPRRPKLKCASASGSKITNHEMAGDMRAITVFLNAILRGNAYMQNLYVRSFFGLSSTTDGQQSQPASLDTTGSFMNEIAAPPASISTDIDHPASDGSNINLMLSSNASSTNPQDKWRKLYVNMRVKIKPHEIGIRCFLFEGVVSGIEVASWLVRPSYDSSSSSSSSNPARDRVEACAIGQELLNCGLLATIAWGFEGEGDEIRQSSLSLVEDSTMDSQFVPSKRFSDQYGYIYRFRESSSTAKTVGSSTLFGAYVKVTIPHYTNAEDDEEAEVTSRDTLIAMKSNGVVAKSSDATGDGNSLLAKRKGHVEYLVTVEHGGDEWRIWKRYRQFEQLHRALLKEGVRSDATLPAKSFTKAFGSTANEVALDSRRQGLESFLQSTIEAVLQTRVEKALEILAAFLDDDYTKLRFVGN